MIPFALRVMKKIIHLYLINTRKSSFTWSQSYAQQLLCFVFYTGRNIIVIVVASAIAAGLHLRHHVEPFTLTGYIPGGIPSFSVPRFTVNTSHPNSTEDGRIISFAEITQVHVQLDVSLPPTKMTVSIH